MKSRAANLFAIALIAGVPSIAAAQATEVKIADNGGLVAMTPAAEADTAGSR